VVAGNPSVMAGREAALCRANWASELSCIIRRWARGVCTKHNSLVSCSSSSRAQHGTSSSGTGSRGGWLSPSCLGERLGPGQGALGTRGGQHIDQETRNAHYKGGQCVRSSAGPGRRSHHAGRAGLRAVPGQQGSGLGSLGGDATFT